MPFRKGTSENTILFFEGGHSHDGVSSALIDVDEYSIYDFIVGKIGSSTRQATQQRNFDNLKTVICNIVTTDILGPAGVRLAPNSVQSVHIQAGAVTANELSANIVLVNNVISSGNYSTGVSGWSINSNGTAEFDQTMIRGVLTADALFINNTNFWYANGTFSVGTANSLMTFNGSTLAVTGTVTATDGQIGGWLIEGDSLVTGGNFSGDMTLGKFPGSSGFAGMLVAGQGDGNGVYPQVNVSQGTVTLTRTDGTNVSQQTTYTSQGVVYDNHSAQKWEFVKANNLLYAVVDGVAYCLQQCGNNTNPPTTDGNIGTDAPGGTTTTTTVAPTTLNPNYPNASFCTNGSCVQLNGSQVGYNDCASLTVFAGSNYNNITDYTCSQGTMPACPNCGGTTTTTTTTTTASPCGAPVYDYFSNDGGNGWTKSGGVYNLGQNHGGASCGVNEVTTWQNYTKANCNAYALFIYCQPAAGPTTEAPTSPPATTTAAPTSPPATSPPETTAPPTTSFPEINCAACGGGPGVCITIKGEAGCV